MCSELPLALLSIEGSLDPLIGDPCCTPRYIFTRFTVEALLLRLVLVFASFSDEGIFRGNVRAEPHDVLGRLQFLDRFF
jgi:hypothetical protein